MLHWINAFEDGDWLNLDGFFQINPAPVPPPNATRYETIFRFMGQEQKEPRLHRWRMNLRTGATEEFDLTDVISEFGMINGRHIGRPHRYGYAATRVAGVFLFDGFVKHDLETGAAETVKFPTGVFGSEVAMAPRIGSSSEDDGYLIRRPT